MQARGHRKQLTKGDLSFGWIVQRHRLRQIFFVENLRLQAFGNLRFFLGQHDARGDAGVYLSHGSGGRYGFAVAPPVVPLINQPTVTNNQKAAVLAGAGSICKGLVELLHINAGAFSDSNGVF